MANRKQSRPDAASRTGTTTCHDASPAASAEAEMASSCRRRSSRWKQLLGSRCSDVERKIVSSAWSAVSRGT